MTISEHTESFFGRSVVDYASDQPVDAPPATTVYRLSLDYDAEQSMVELLQEFLSRVDTTQLQALVIGAWDEPHENDPSEVLDELARRAPDLPALEALFVGDITFEECEISWIVQAGYADLLSAFPRLKALRVRGSTSLEWPVVEHAHLRHLVIECGGLPREVSEAIGQSRLPALEHLELWIGTDEYGFDGDARHIADVVTRVRTTALRYLGLRDAEVADELAAWLAGEAWVASLDTLDLSLGTLGDTGAQALLASPHVRGVRRVDLSHHFIGEALQAQLRAAIPGVVLDDPQEDDDGYRYVAVGE